MPLALATADAHAISPLLLLGGLFLVATFCVVVARTGGWLIPPKLAADDPPPRVMRGIEILLVFVLFVIVAAGMRNVILDKTDIDLAKFSETTVPTEDLPIVIWLDAAGNLLTLAGACVLLKVLHRRDGVELGFGWDRLRSDITAGLLTAGMLTGPVLATMLLVEQFQDYHHPMIDNALKNPSLSLLTAVTFSAGLIAPLFEEFVFRGLFQSWLTGLELRWSAASGRPLLHPGWMPNVVASAFFAMMHLEQGPAPIPLFFLSLGLGHLYHRTRRIYASWTAHAAFNAVTVAQLWLEHFAQR